MEPDVYLVVYRPTYITDLGLYVQGARRLTLEEAFVLLKKPESVLMQIGHLTGKDVDRLKNIALKAKDKEEAQKLFSQPEEDGETQPHTRRGRGRGRNEKPENQEALDSAGH
jgi:hypothetical protein